VVGNYEIGAKAGSFAFAVDPGQAIKYIGFRVVLVP